MLLPARARLSQDRPDELLPPYGHLQRRVRLTEGADK